jgi:lipoprotein-releasing system ATP-binding protein
LIKTYGHGEAATRVLRGLSLQLDVGDLAALLGPSGSGKSTLLSILGTLMQPMSGSDTMLEQDLLAADDTALTTFRNLHIGFVFQLHNLLPDFTALENVVFPTAVRAGRETASARARGRELLTWMGLADRIEFPTTKLSGGQKQRVAVARALMNRPELVLADEPTGNLDRDSATQVMELIAEINRE